MKKEKITLEVIREDLFKIVKDQIVNKSNWRFAYIIPITLLAVLIGVYFKSVFIGLLIFAVSVYHIVRYVIELNEYRLNKTAIMSLIERGEISVSNEVLSHIASETIYEPHMDAGRLTKSINEMTVYHFSGGSSWRVPAVDKHYSWSKEFYISSKGLENISMNGDEFYFVSLQAHHDIAYIYPCKNFELDKNLKK